MQAAEVAKTAAKSIADIQNVAEDSESSKEGDLEESTIEGEEQDEHNEQRKAALDKLEKASEDSLLGQACHSYRNKFIIFLCFFFLDS